MKKNLTIGYNEYIVKFRNTIKSLGLNNSVQREYVLKTLFEHTEHLSVEQIQQKVKETYHTSIGIATVYRILNLFEEMHIISVFLLEGNDSKVYELNLVSHHDHLVCTKCNKIVEFYDIEIEKLQEEIAHENGFVLQSHTMILYGICKECQENA